MQPILDRNTTILPIPLSGPATGLKKFVAACPPHLGWSLAGVGLLLLGWQVLAMNTHTAIVASPVATVKALYQMIISGQMLTEMTITLKRLLIALAMGGAIGFGLGVSAGFSPACRALLEPIRWMMMALPAIFIAILGLLWFGVGDKQVIFLVTVIAAPVVYLNTLAGFDSLDQQLIEVGRVYRFSRWQFLTEVYLPGIGFNAITGLTLAAGIGVRAVLMAEVLGAADGIGHSFNRAWTFLKTPELFAWMLVSLLLMALLELGLLKPLRRALLHWQQGSA